MKLFKRFVISALLLGLANANGVYEIKFNIAPALINNIVSKKFSDIKYIYSELKKEKISLYFNTNKTYNFSTFIPFRESEFKYMKIKKDYFYIVKR